MARQMGSEAQVSGSMDWGADSDLRGKPYGRGFVRFSRGVQAGLLGGTLAALALTFGVWGSEEPFRWRPVAAVAGAFFALGALFGEPFVRVLKQVWKRVDIWTNL